MTDRDAAPDPYDDGQPPRGHSTEVDLSVAAGAVRAWLAAARHVLIGAGAGMTAAAGIDYGDEADFAARFPVLVRKGFRARYQLIGYEHWTPAQHWAYWATHVAQIRFGPRDDAVYRRLLELTRDKDRFVLTSNVDGLFPRNGFDEDRLYTPQGDYALLQCRRACTQDTWPSRPVVERILPAIDAATFEVRDPAVIPSCPHCGGPVFFNVRIDHTFVERPYEAQAKRFTAWVGSALPQPLLVLEIGAGFNTPGVVRWPLERIARAGRRSHFVRVNPRHPEVPRDLAGTSLSLPVSAAAAVDALWAETQRRG